MNRATARARSRWNRRLGQVLVTTGALADEELARWMDEAEASADSLAAVLVRRRACDSRVVLEAMSQISGLSVVDPFEEPPEPEAMKLISAKLARDLNAIGYRLEGPKLVLAFVDPPEAEELRALAVVFERQVLAVLATPMAVQAVIETAYPPEEQTQPDLSDPAVVARVMMEAQARITMAATPPAGSSEPAPPTPSATETAPEAQEPLDLLIREAEQAVQATGPEPSQPAPPSSPPSGANLLDWGPEPAPIPSEPLVAASGNGAGRSPVGLGEGVLPLHIDDLLEIVCAAGASDLHLSAGRPPSMRLNGSIRPIEGYEPLDGQTVREMVFGILTQTLRERFEANKELDTSHALPGVGRFRVNVFMQRNCVAAVLRAIPHTIPPFESLGLPPVIKTFTELQRGLVLVTGPTGSGKSTTLASLIDIINKTKPVHIVTVEDPIEFLHRHQHAIINQREVGQDTHGFSEALRHVLRQDPDVILVGEMRDLETISTALTAAETGHLVFATLHTQDAPQTIDRIIDVFPTAQQDQIRVQLSTTLEAVVTQQLVLTADGTGRVVVPEVMVATPAIRNLIREAKTHQIPSLMQAGGKFGMQTMDQALAALVKAGKITQAVAYARCHSEEELGRYLQG